MNNDPFAHGHPPEFLPDESALPQRTSVMAILSLVFSLTCCLSPLGLIFGGISLVGISRSGGRLRGQGLAIAGIGIGLVGSVLLIASAYGASQINRVFGAQFMGPIENVVVAIEQGDYGAARSAFDPSVQASLTDQAFLDFQQQVSAQMGSYRSMPSGIIELISAYAQVGPMLEQYQQKHGSLVNTMPIPSTFDNGTALILVEMPRGSSSGQPASGILPPILNMAVVFPDGTVVWLIDPTGGAAAPAGP